MPEDTGLTSYSTNTIRRAAALLDAVFEELADPARWCQHRYALTARGIPIVGPLLDVIESPEAARRCLFSSLVHHGLARGYRIEVDTGPLGESAREVTRAPRSWMLAGLALASVALETIVARALVAPAEKSNEARGALRLGQLVVSTTVVLNDEGSYADVIWTVALAAELLREELDRRAEATQ